MSRGIEKKVLGMNSINLATITSSSIVVSAEGSLEYRNINQALPFGIVSKAKVGQNIVIAKPYGDPAMAVGNGIVVDSQVKVKDKVSGTLKEVLNITLEEGETLLYSEGGATIKLCNDGRIILNRKLVIKPDGTTEILGEDDVL